MVTRCCHVADLPTQISINLRQGRTTVCGFTNHVIKNLYGNNNWSLNEREKREHGIISTRNKEKETQTWSEKERGKESERERALSKVSPSL